MAPSRGTWLSYHRHGLSFCFLLPAMLLAFLDAGEKTVSLSGNKEVRAFVDEAGRLHWQGQVFSAQGRLVSESSADSQAPCCAAGTRVPARYGGINKSLELPQKLPAKELLAMSCSEAFGEEDSSRGRFSFSGHVIFSCSPTGSLSVRYNCGCAAGPVPILILRGPASRKVSECFGKSIASIDSGVVAEDVMWSDADLPEGGFESRPCLQLQLESSGDWQIHCHEGQLCADTSDCDQHSAEHTPVPDVESTIQSEEPLISPVSAGSSTKISVFRRLAKARRLSPCIGDIVQDFWWPGICYSVRNVPYSTAAGARLPGSGSLQFSSNRGVFVSHFTGDVFVVDWGNHRIQRWTKQGSATTVAGMTGETGNALDTTRLFHPADLFIAGDTTSDQFGCGELFIADEGNHRILRWPPGSPTGFIVAGGGIKAGKKPSELNKPSGLWVTDDLDIYIADQLNNRIVVWSKEDRKLSWAYNRTVAGQTDTATGTSLDLLGHPTDVALDKDFHVYVSDFNNDRIVKWNVGATQGILIGKCFGAMSVYVNVEGSVYAACQTSHCIKRWDFIQDIWDPQTDTGDCGYFSAAPAADAPGYAATVSRFYAPSGVFVDNFENVFVSDTSNARIIKRGRAPLTQWIGANSAATTYSWQVTDIAFFEDLNCNHTVPAKSFISADGAVSEPWTPRCTNRGEGRCAAEEAYIGRQFIRAAGIRCVKLTVTYIDPAGDSFGLSVRYWVGTLWQTVYRFGGILSGVPTILRLPRFDVPTHPPTCVKGRRQCIFTNLIGDWQHDDDRLLVKLQDCDTGLSLPGLPSGAKTHPATVGGTRFELGSQDIPEVVSVDASDGTAYKLCWCDRKAMLCQLGSEFKQQIGLLRVEGPYRSQTHQAWRGAPFVIAMLQGVGLVSGDRMTVVSGSCGLAATDVIGIPKQIGALIAYSMPSATGVDYSWGNDFVRAKPGGYDLCWCRPVNLTCCMKPVNRACCTCAVIIDFQATSGILVINGPALTQSFSCIKGEICDLTLSGVGFEIGDKVMVMSRCGQDPVASGFPKNIGSGTSAGTSVRYTWGDEAAFTPAGIYYACWCSLRYNCQLPTDFLAEVGLLTVSGPEPAPLECAVGADCSITSIQGVRLYQSSRVVVLPFQVECGHPQAQAPDRFPGDVEGAGYGISYPAYNDGTAFDLGLMNTLIVLPAPYRVCWCHIGRNCTEPVDFRVFLGEMTMRGPYTWNDTAVCGSGKDCAVIAMGYGLSPSDTMLIIDDTTGGCGDGGVIATGQSVIDGISRSDTGINHVWDADKVPGGGNYIVCWCNIIGGCTDIEQFRMKVGKLIISAPYTNHNLFCTSGAPCKVLLEGFGLQVTDKVGLVVSQLCGTNDVLRGVPNNAISMSTFNVPITKQSANFKFGGGESEEKVTSTGGVFTLCWCPYRCNLMQDFAFKTGYLSIFAPSSSHYFVCWNGLPCSIDGVVGMGLMDQDRVRVASDCRIETLVGGMPQDGMSMNATSSGTNFTWGSGILSAIVGNFELCWCSAHHRCITALDFATSIGTLVIGGPLTGQTRRCETGYPCHLDKIDGYALRLGDTISLLQTCGTGNPIYGWQPGDAWYPYPPFNASDPCSSGSELDLPCAHFFVNNSASIFKLTADPGQYRMCWCSATSPVGCLTAEDFSVDLGLFTAVGALPGQSFTCAPGFNCSVPEIVGVSLMPGDKYLAQKEEGCKNNAVVEGIPNQGISRPSMAPLGTMFRWDGQLSITILPALYSLCWCPEQFPCDNIEDFVTRAGYLSVVGPYLQPDTYITWVGSQVIIGDVQGHGLQNGDRVLVVNGTCGKTAKLAPFFPGDALSDPATVAGTRYEYDFLINAISGSYRICWCGASQVTLKYQFECLNEDNTPIMASFLVDLGELFLPEIPKSGQVRECISGIHCSIDGFVGSIGEPLPNEARILMMKPVGHISNATCGASTPWSDFSGGGASDPGSDGGTGEPGTYYEWGNASFAIWAAGGEYLMCWKPIEAQSYKYLLGIMDVTGPIGGPTQDFSCTKSAVCRLENVQGFGLMDGDYFRVMVACAKDVSRDEAADLLVAGVETVQRKDDIVQWEIPEFQGNPNQYMLCWCYHGAACSDASDFKTEAGSIVIYGPTPGQNRKCDRGYDCSVENITGINLQPLDYSQILVECNTGPEVAGFTPKSVQAKEQEDELFQFSWKYVTSLPGIFRICWCESTMCGMSEQMRAYMASFDVEVGIITIQGPTDVDLTKAPPLLGPYEPVIDVSATNGPLYGKPWDLTINGVNLQVSPDARIRIMLKCPSDKMAGIPIKTFKYIGVPKADDDTGSRYEFSEYAMFNITPAVELDATPALWLDNKYMVCWCRGRTALDPTADCETESKFSLSLGPVAVFCSAGYEPNGTTCSPCKIGQFKDSNGNTICKLCPPFQTTAEVGTVRSYRCYCPAGLQLLNKECKPCPEEHFCTGGFNLGAAALEDEKTVILDQDHTAAQICPKNSGAWNPENCMYGDPSKLYCTGIFPAKATKDCSCNAGHDQFVRDTISECRPCRSFWFKPYRGNVTQCTPCEETYALSSTRGAKGSTSCGCEDGYYMVKDDATGDPVFCSECPAGYYCTFSEKTMCDPGTWTAGQRSLSKDDCKCGAGYFRYEKVCTSCKDGFNLYKETIGDEPCSEFCPDNSIVPLGVFGARGPENCLCKQGYIMDLNKIGQDDFEFYCKIDAGGESKELRKSVDLSAVKGEFFLSYVVPDTDAAIPDSSLLSDVSILFATQLGLPDATRVNIIILESEPAPADLFPAQISTRRLSSELVETNASLQRVLEWDNTEWYEQQQWRRLATNVTNTTLQRPVKLKVQIVVWQSTVAETKELKQRFAALTKAGSGVEAQMQDGLLRANSVKFNHLLPAPDGLLINSTATRIGFWTEYCPPNSAVLPGALFTSTVDSCLCSPGFEPLADVPEVDRPEAAELGDVEYDTTLKCVPCYSVGDVGKYKDNVGDDRCWACPTTEGRDDYLFPKTEPFFGANHSDLCICAEGYFRRGTLVECEVCPIGFWCTGVPIATPCPANEWSILMGNSKITECKCDKGFFRSLDEMEKELCPLCPDEIKDAKGVAYRARCVDCDESYYKSNVDDGIGRCTDRCTLYFGARSTSVKGARSQEECVCQVSSYMAAEPTSITGEECTLCPSEGVECLGGKVNVTDSNVTHVWTFLDHAPPSAKVGFFMLNVKRALVSECLTSDEDGSVCQGGYLCAAGHEGLICGNCQKGYKRDKHPMACSACADMPDDFSLVMKLFFDFFAMASLNQFLAVSALQKTETQKNVLTVLLRMFQHWSSQVQVLTSNFNLSKLEPMQSSKDEDEEEDTSNATKGVLLPIWFSQVSRNLMVYTELLQSLGSQQEVVECLIDRQWGAGVLSEAEKKNLVFWKLLGPAIWWFLFPVLMVSFTILFAMCQGFVLIPILRHIVQGATKRKKKKKRKPHDDHTGDAKKKKAEENNDIFAEEDDEFADLSSSSGSDDDMAEDDLANNAEIAAVAYYKPQMLPIADELTPGVSTPSRFSFEYVSKDFEDDAEDAESLKYADYVLKLFPSPPKLGWKFIHAIFPWIVITLNNCWNTVTTRMLQLINCEGFRWSGSPNPAPDASGAYEEIDITGWLLMHPDTQCYTFAGGSEHGYLAIVAFMGLLLWSVGIVMTLYLIIRGRDKQKSFVTRNFGYLLEGYEPQYWYWELLVKKVDLLCTAIITYTSIANDARAKILLYSVQASIFHGLQLYLSPYDNRQLMLLDKMENKGLLIREILFTGIAFCLLFNTPGNVTMAVSVILISLNCYFVLNSLTIMVDDWVATQIAVRKQKRVEHVIEFKRKVVHKRKKDAINKALASLGARRITQKMRKEALANIKIDTHVKDEDVKPKWFLEKLITGLCFIQDRVFAGGSHDGYRQAQLLRLVWNGPGSDAQIYIPSLYDGSRAKKKTWQRTLRLKLCKMFYGMNDDSMLNALSDAVGSFVALLITLAEFNQCPSRLTDMIFFLSRAVKVLKHNLEDHPNATRPPRKLKDGQMSDFVKFNDLEALKISLLQEVFCNLMHQTKEKQVLLETVRNGHLRDTLAREKVPLDAAWDVLDKLTNDQLRRAKKCPVEMYSRVEFNIALSMCSENMLETIHSTIKDHEKEKKERKRINNFLKFHLREYLDTDPDLDWHEIHQMLNTMPIVELNRLTENPDRVVELAKKQKADTGPPGLNAEGKSVLTVEDLNVMVMFLQKLPFNELHQIIEFTQLLIDFLDLPTNAKWRDQVVRRGRREAEVPTFYRGMFDMRQQLDKFETQQEAEAALRLEREGAPAGDNPNVVDSLLIPPVGLDGILEDPPEVEVQLHRFLKSSAVHETAQPEAQLRRIMHDHDDISDDAGSQSDAVSLTSVDSAIQVPTDEPFVDELSGTSPNDPLWRKIDELRARATGLMDAVTRPEGVHNLPALTAPMAGARSSGGMTEMSLDDLDSDLEQFETAMRQASL